MSDPVLERLGELVSAELQRWAAMHTADDASVGIDEPGDELVAFLLEHAPHLRAWSERAVASPDPTGPWHAAPALYLRQRLVHWMQSNNQFLEVDPDTLRDIEAAYGKALLAAGRALGGDPHTLARRLGELLAEHRRELRELLAGRVRGADREVICAEYTPDLQLAILGLEGTRLPQPVLDLGCGSEAHLVLELRKHGIPAVGLDRQPNAGGVVGDWLTQPLGKEQWGSILSHLGFSLHFIHQHVASEKLAAQYAQRLMAILAALTPGGVFAYAPGLPFIEPIVESRGYDVVQVELPEALRKKIPAELNEAVGQDVGYAGQIWRR